MSSNHGSKIFGSQQKGAQATTTAMATRTAKKQYFYISKTRTLQVHHAFLHIFQPSLYDCNMKLLNFMHLLYGVGEHNTKSFSFFF